MPGICRRAVVLARCLCVFVAALSGSAAAQDSPYLETGLRANRDYLAPTEFERIDTFTGNVMLTFTDLVLPGNAGRELRLQRTYSFFFGNPLQPKHWSFGIAGVPMRIAEKNYPQPTSTHFQIRSRFSNLTRRP